MCGFNAEMIRHLYGSYYSRRTMKRPNSVVMRQLSNTSRLLYLLDKPSIRGREFYGTTDKSFSVRRDMHVLVTELTTLHQPRHCELGPKYTPG
jgi:hypothetical protein